MAEIPRHSEEITPEIRQIEGGLDVSVARRNAWHFQTLQEARRYFRRQQLQFTALHWGIRILFLAGVANVVRDVDEVIRTHDLLTVAGAIVGGVLSVIAEGVNERNIRERVLMHREVVRRFGRNLHTE